MALFPSLLGLLGLAGIGHHYYRHGHEGLGWHGHHGHHGHHGQHEHSEMMQKKCDEGFKIIKCHRQCGEDMQCHDKCPLPECPKMAAKVKGIIQCNVDCGSDFACRESCNRPVKKFVEMCSMKKPISSRPQPNSLCQSSALARRSAKVILHAWRSAQSHSGWDLRRLAKRLSRLWNAMGLVATTTDAM